MKSLDPRVNRLSDQISAEEVYSKNAGDQLSTYEIFVQPAKAKPFQHEGSLHAPDLEMAFVLAKETFTRRFTCSSLWVTPTDAIWVSELTDNNNSIYNTITEQNCPSGQTDRFEIFHLLKRGKRHIHAGTVDAVNHEEAFTTSLSLTKPDLVVYNVWTIRQSDIRKPDEEELAFWDTLAEKKFRDASAYKGGDKLKEFLTRHNK